MVLTTISQCVIITEKENITQEEIATLCRK
jgi:hypothetical protein